MGSVRGSKPQDLPVLTLNCGSSSLKFGIYLSDGETVTAVCEGEAQEIGRNNASFQLGRGNATIQQKVRLELADHVTALAHALDALKSCDAPQPSIAAHRFVHGGPRIREHQRVTDEVLKELRSAVAYAPLHLPAALSVLEAMQKKLPDIPQMACLDTAFHRDMPEVSRTYALPIEIRELSVERYGFHGLSIESILAQLGAVPERLVVAHLGNGSSITGIHKGRSIDTSMGMTPTGGVMMGTRCGDLDPGVVIYLARHGYKTPDELEILFDRHSGLLGVSGVTSDVRELLSARKQHAQADLALKMFCYQVRKTIAAMAAALGGLDALVFTGGIGEHANELREEICSGIRFLGNFRMVVLPAQEDLQMARIAVRFAKERSPDR